MKPISNWSKMANKTIASILDAVIGMEYNRESYSEYGDKIILRLLMHKLMGLRTFLLCLQKLGTEDTSFPYPSVEDNSDTDSSSVESDLRETEDNNDNTEARQPLKYLFERLQSFLDDIHSNDYDEDLLAIESFEEEIDRWYTSMSDYLPQASSSPVANQVEEIFSSVLRNLDDFLSLHIAYVGAVVAPVEALKVNITFWRNFLHFATFLGTGQLQEFLDFLTHMEGLAFSAAHFTADIFSDEHYNIKFFSDSERNLRAKHHWGSVYGDVDAAYSPHSSETCYDRIRSTVSALLLRINPLDNPHLYESYTRVLESMKCSRESYVPNLYNKGSSDLLLSMLWEVLQFQNGPALAFKDKLQELYEGLRFLRALFKKHPNKFDGEVGAITRAAIFDVGVIIFSVYQNHDSINNGVEEFLGTIKVIRTQVEEQVANTSTFNFPKTTALAFLDFLLNYLMEVESSNVDSDTPSCAQRVRDHLLLLRYFMEKMVKLKNQQEELHQTAWNFAVEVAYKIELLIDQLVLGDIPDSDLMSLQSITEDMETIKTDSAMIFDDRREEIEVPLPQEVTSTHTDQVSSIPLGDEFVGFEDERISIMDRLTRRSKKLQVVAIVGMPGLGKTTLATKVYNEPLVQQHFHVRAWCSISQEFNKRKVLLELLNQIPVLKSDESSGDYSKMTEDELAQELRRSLLRHTSYLIYIDDVWDIKAFERLKLSFPIDSSGRILLTSRIDDVAKLDDYPHFLRQRTISESLELLQKKVSPGKGWPQSLYGIAVKIAENCNGLPLIINIVAGLLATAKQDVWEEVLGSLTSGIISSTDQCKRTIELSYKHLPEHLKPCFLSFASFPEDEEISVKRLIWLWMAEGLVRKTDSRRLEEVAADYLDNLIGRSLVMKSEKRIGGGIKACRIHDVLLDFCLRKANEENLLHLLNGKDKLLPIEESRNLRRLCVHSKMEGFMDSKLFFPHLRSLSFFGGKTCKEVTDISFISRVYKLLRVLNMEKVRVLSYDFPGEIGLLIQLRYLAISVYSDITPSIGNLSYLETLILDPVYETLVTMPDTFWNLQKLRHLYLNNMRRNGDEFHGIILPVDNVESSCNLLELENLSGLHSEEWGSMENQLKKFPNIRRLKSWLHKFGNGSKVMSYSFLSRLESLSLSFDDNSTEFDFIFPESIKKLNLSRCSLPWEKISRIAKLPNLEVLKLLDECFVGERWQVEEGEFSKLRFLKLEYLDVIKWTGCDDQFPNLEKLVVVECDQLKETPECLENVDTLEMIEVISCSDDVESLFKTLADYLSDMGNSVLQFHVRSSKTKVSFGESDSASEEGSGNEEDT